MEEIVLLNVFGFVPHTKTRNTHILTNFIYHLFFFVSFCPRKELKWKLLSLGQNYHVLNSPKYLSGVSSQIFGKFLGKIFFCRAFGPMGLGEHGLSCFEQNITPHGIFQTFKKLIFVTKFKLLENVEKNSPQNVSGVIDWAKNYSKSPKILPNNFRQMCNNFDPIINNSSHRLWALTIPEQFYSWSLNSFTNKCTETQNFWNCFFSPNQWNTHRNRHHVWKTNRKSTIKNM